MKDQIKKIIKETFKLNSISDEISQRNCSKWDSLNHLHLIFELESFYDISFEPEEIMKMKCLQDIESILNDKISQK